jgi:thioredoxin 1
LILVSHEKEFRMSTVVHADDPTAFDVEVLQATVPVVVDFWADWCGPCRMIAPELEALAGERSDLKVVKVDVDANPEVAARYDIRGIPTVALFRGGQRVAVSVGAKPRRTIEAELGIAVGVEA